MLSIILYDQNQGCYQIAVLYIALQLHKFYSACVLGFRFQTIAIANTIQAKHKDSAPFSGV